MFSRFWHPFKHAVSWLKNDGIIKEFTAGLDAQPFDSGLLASAAFKTNEKRAWWDGGEMIAGIPKEKSGGDEAIASTEKTIVLCTAKDITKRPIKKSKRLKPGG